MKCLNKGKQETDFPYAPIWLSLFTIVLVFTITANPACAGHLRLTPTGGMDTSDDIYDPANLVDGDRVYEEYAAESKEFDPSAYQEYRFDDLSFPPHSYLTEASLTVLIREKRLGGAMLQICVEEGGRCVEESLDVSSSDGKEILLHRSLMDVFQSSTRRGLPSPRDLFSS